MKNNDAEYDFEEAIDAELLALSEERMAKFTLESVVSGEDVYEHLGITKYDIDNCDEVEFE